MRTTVRLSCVLAIAACGDPANPPVDDPDAPVVPSNPVVVDKLGGSPVFIGYRTDGGDWQTPADNGDSYGLLVGTDYELVAVCGNDATGFEIGVMAATFEDLPSTSLPCFTPAATQSLAVTGTMKQPGTVYLDDSESSATPDWSFSLSATAGAHDLIAVDADRALIRRNLDIEMAQALAEVDTVADGKPMVARSFTVDASPDEDPFTMLSWQTDHTFAFIDQADAGSVRLPDPSQLAATDQLFVYLGFSQGDSFRSAYVRQGAGSPTSIPLLPQLAGVVVDDHSATWTGALPGNSAAVFYAFSGNNYVYAQASLGWQTLHHALAIDLDIPGYQPEWRADEVDYANFESTDDSIPLVLRSTDAARPSSQKRSTRATTLVQRHAARRLAR